MKTKFTLLLLSFLVCSTLSFAQVGLDLDGTDDYIQTTYSGIQGTGDRTIEAWIKTTGNFVPGGGGGVQGVLVDYGTFSTGQRFTFNVLWANAIRLEVGGNGVSGTIAVNDGNWHHVAAVFSNPGNNVALYVDGVLDTQNSLTVAANTGSANDVMIGRRVDGINNFPGSIDEVRIWNYARTQAEIQANMNSELCNLPSSLVAYYQFNEGTPGANNTAQTTVIDNSGNGNNGTLNNFTLNGNSSNWVTGPTLSTPTGNNTFSTIGTTNCNSYTTPSGKTITSSGMYMDTIPNTQCGDSIITINATINTNTSETIDVTACYKYFAPNGDIYITSQVLNFTLQNYQGCDSLLTVNLTVLTPSSSITETSCGDYTTPSGTILTSSQTYTDTLTAVSGCDSLITIDLTITEIDTSLTIFLDGSTLGSDEDNPNATYQWYECSNGTFTLLQDDTAQVYTASTNGFYAVVISLDGCSDTSECVQLIGTNTQNQYLQSNISLFPNPTNGNFTIDLGENYQDIIIEIFGLDGKLISNQIFKNEQQINAKIDAIAGLYQVKITTEKGVANKMILKE